jgi:4-hydroxythreonine-4-phosphate dehydrogenase
MIKPQIILITSGEPAGIGPDICLDLASFTLDVSNHDYTLVILGDIKLLCQRAELLGKYIQLTPITPEDILANNLPSTATNELLVLNIDCPSHDCIGQPQIENAAYVLTMLAVAAKLCKDGQSISMVTAPVHKGIINQAGYKFSGHTEYLADTFGVAKVVMLLANQYMKVAVLTTHIPLRDVSKHITVGNLNQTLRVIYDALNPENRLDLKVAVCGLNPHAGEGGNFGDEEINIINPVIKSWQEHGYLVSGSHSADTIFNHADKYDVILAMYHDQGLPVLKYSGFETGVNITLGLPIVRTSVDHGTALDLAGSGAASSKSLKCAIKMAIQFLG